MIQDVLIGQVHAHAIVLPGLLCPGFINAHCHLELSDLLGVLPRNTGLVAFIKNINAAYKARQNTTIPDAIKAADEAMYARGINAVADICNTAFTAEVKRASKIYYHNFAEVFGAIPAMAATKFTGAQQLVQSLGKATITPHATYSISAGLWQLIQQSTNASVLLSIHNQECAQEDQLISTGTGALAEMLQHMSTEIPAAVAHNYSNIAHISKQLPNTEKMLFVHNTFTSAQDVAIAKANFKERYWCVCPMANDYIEQRINPMYASLHTQGEQVVIGTDSLASNDTLCMVSELHMLHKYLPELSTETSLQWATYNGAEMLQQPMLGRLEVACKPGLVHVANWQTQDKVPENPIISRLY
jgi:aminodeoxyfutalosine deaminase